MKYDDFSTEFTILSEFIDYSFIYNVEIWISIHDSCNEKYEKWIVCLYKTIHANVLLNIKTMFSKFWLPSLSIELKNVLYKKQPFINNQKVYL